MQHPRGLSAAGDRRRARAATGPPRGGGIARGSLAARAARAGPARRTNARARRLSFDVRRDRARSAREAGPRTACRRQGGSLRKTLLLALTALAAFLAADLATYADATRPADAYGPHPAGTVLHPVRQAIIATALGEVGAVSDRGGTPPYKKGWQRLKQYFDEASDWGPDSFRMGTAVRDGIMLAGRNPPGGAWCGIFATWCCVQAGVNARWRFGVGPRPLSARYDVANVAPGDIGVIPQYVHHFVITRRDGDTLECVNGNSTDHGITRSTRSVRSLAYFYRPIPDVWVDDGSGTWNGGTPPPAAEPELRRGSHGEAVVRLQKLLDGKGYSLVQDGWFGALTDGAVRDFQAKHGLGVDGVVGPTTWSALQGP
jgi:hypothetical protein